MKSVACGGQSQVWQRLSGGEQDVFAAAQAVPAIAQPGAALSVDSNADLLGIQCFDAPPFAGQCGPLTFGQLSLDGVPSNRLATGMQSRWRPHEIVRNATLWRTGSTARIHGRAHSSDAAPTLAGCTATRAAAAP